MQKESITTAKQRLAVWHHFALPFPAFGDGPEYREYTDLI